MEASILSRASNVGLLLRGPSAWPRELWTGGRGRAQQRAQIAVVVDLDEETGPLLGPHLERRARGAAAIRARRVDDRRGVDRAKRRQRVRRDRGGHEAVTHASLLGARGGR